MTRSTTPFRFLFLGAGLLLASSACSRADPYLGTDSGASIHRDGGPADPNNLCSTPGSVLFDHGKQLVVPGGDPTAPDMTWVTLPDGFCVHHYANVPFARQVRVAPGGEVFVSSPMTATTGGGNNGNGKIFVIPDDDGDLAGDANRTFLDNLPSTQGLLFVPDWLYYQDKTQIRRVPYRSGDRQPSGLSELVEDITIYSSIGHWPKTIDIADDGTLYVGNGGDQGEACDTTRPFHGGILALDGTPGGRPIVKGLRNPIVVRCQRGHNQCFALELSRDYSATMGGREKLIPVHAGDDWGFPCCATKDLPYPDVKPLPDCTAMVGEDNSFVIGNTPFGLDFVPDDWPAPWAGSAVVSLHGEFGTWVGAKIVTIATDPQTGSPLPSSTVDGAPPGAILDFAGGWDDGHRSHGRPADLTFAPDGRLFVADDVLGEIFWIAPMTGPVDGVTTPDGGATVDAGAADVVHHRDVDNDIPLGCASSSVSFETDVQLVLMQYCISCHVHPTPAEQLDLSPEVAWDSLVNGSSRQCASRQLVAPGDPDNSYLWNKLQGQQLCNGTAPMPPMGPGLTAMDLETVRNWICMGAPDN